MSPYAAERQHQSLQFMTLLNGHKTCDPVGVYQIVYKPTREYAHLKSQITSDRFTGISHLPKKRTVPLDIRLELCAPTLTQIFSMRKSIQTSIHNAQSDWVRQTDHPECHAAGMRSR